jgi:sugar-specific transcriptional regulator TrmB
MELNDVLIEIGLTTGEAKIYLALTKLGSSPVNKITKETSLHRTAIYDFIERLITKGLVSYVIKSNVRYYKATEPIKLLDLLKEKQKRVEDILPTLEKLSDYNKEDVKVEVYRGKEGIKTILNDIVRTKKECLNFGIDDSIFKKILGSYLEGYFVRAREAKIKERCLTYQGAPFVDKRANMQYRFIPKEFFNPTVTEVYGNKVAIIIWEPLMAILIENEQLASSYRKHFEMLWMLASKENKLDSKTFLKKK